MDQDSFRQLLQTPRAGSSGTSATTRGSFLASSSAKHKTIDASQPAFKPRKVKKKDSQYRDRAAERRVGEGNDFAEVEAVLETFEKSTAGNEDKAAVDEQRKYLGGDQAHTILVKGLDISLLEQNKARAAQVTHGDDDESLEQAFQEVGPRKRTKEDIVRELKEAQKGGEIGAREEGVTKEVPAPAKNAGKFKPIGFKPIGAPADGKKKKKKRGEEDGERKKKKRKVENGEDSAGKAGEEMLPPPPPPKPTEPEPEPIPDEFDIFAGAGEYEGIDLGDDDDDEEDGEMKDVKPAQPSEEPSTIPIPRGGWFTTDEDQSPNPPPQSHSPSAPRDPSPPEEGEDSEPEQQPTRLVPLSSSALPSIRDLLAADEAQDKNKKWKNKNKEKKGGSGKEVDSEEKKKATAEAKAERDYKRLKSYQEKKAAGGS